MPVSNLENLDTLNTIEFIRRKTIPTFQQKTQCYILCCWFTRLYLPINIVRLDERTGNMFFLAGEENIIEIYSDGKGRYIQ